MNIYKRAIQLATLVTLLCAGLASTAALAATFTFSGAGTYPPCSGAWSGSGPYTCSGALTLASGDGILPAGNITIIVNNDLTLSGGNAVGAAGNNVNLQSAGKIAMTNAVVQGSVSGTNGGSTVTLSGGSVSGPVGTLSNISATNTGIGAAVTSSNGAIALTGGSVAGNVIGKNAVAISGGATIGGSISATNGAVAVTGGSVAGGLTSGCCAITTTDAAIGGALFASNGAVTVTRGSVNGNITSGCCDITTTGATIVGSLSAVTGDITVTGGSVDGNITSGCCDITLTSTAIDGNVSAAGKLTITSSTVSGTCTYRAIAGVCRAPVSSLDHVRLNISSSGITCVPSSVTVTACNGADSAGVCTLNTGGLTGTVVATDGGTQLASVAFTIAPGASSTTVSVPVTVAKPVVVLGTNGLSVTPANATTCWNGSAASCNQAYADAGFLFSVPDHVSELAQTVVVKAVKKSDNSNACMPAFGSVSQAVPVSVVFTCGYTNPSTGTLPVRVGGAALNAGNNAAAACDSGGRAVSLSFLAGSANVAVQYADAGQLSLKADYGALNMTGNDSFIAAPRDFAFSATSAGPIKAGNNFSATVTARNNSGTATPNFGKESPTQVPLISFSKCLPSPGAGGTFSGSLAGGFVGGAAGAVNLNWNEVGNGDLVAALSNYLGSGLAVGGNTGTGGIACNGVGGAGSVGRFVPDHFDVAVTAASANNPPASPAVTAFTYSGQPINATVTARSKGGTTTVNYAGAFANSVTLSAWNGVSAAAPAPTQNPGPGALANFTIPAANFSAGAAPAAPAYTLTNVLTAPTAVWLHASESGVATPVTSASGAEGTILIRSGRLRLSNAFGSATTPLSLPVRAEYWTGQSWLLNTDDSFSAVPKSSLALRPASTGLLGVAVGADVTLSSGRGAIALSKPTSGTGSVDLTANLGSGTADQSCLAIAGPPGTSGAAQPWLRAKNSACTFDRDPSARATFGVPANAGEIRKVVHIRESFN